MWKFHCMPMKLEFMRWMENIEEIGNGKSMKKHNGLKIFIMILVISAGIILKINKYEWIVCILCFAIVIGGELFNTAIETVVDIVMPYKNEKAKLAKDVSAGAVLILAMGAAICGLIIFVPKIF